MRIFASFRYIYAKINLAQLLARRVNGIFLANFEQGEILVPPRLPDGTGGVGVKGPRAALPRRQMPALSQGEEPDTPRLSRVQFSFRNVAAVV